MNTRRVTISADALSLMCTALIELANVIGELDETTIGHDPADVVLTGALNQASHAMAQLRDSLEWVEDTTTWG
jgi:hypothetical protein